MKLNFMLGVNYENLFEANYGDVLKAFAKLEIDVKI